jgi:hypothetical protein
MGIIASMMWELAQRPITVQLEAEKAWLEFSATHATSKSVWFFCRT